ncbi:immunoglobulin superfamily member 1-like [Hemicordylus capensis]|uniref:immunoglobulin superfamily member 1-like n=1 Tax=Hemicordylus capensis TaxID=884348 RepID=UPI00230279D8|nr:immunoglobulin superfamily member 1-like [Hemicordylus capensis]
MYTEPVQRPFMGLRTSSKIHQSDAEPLWLHCIFPPLDPSLPKPSIKLRSREEGSPGWNVTIDCQGPEDGLTFSLHKSRGLIASRTAEPDTNTAAFSLFVVRLEDLRNYTCQYHLKENPFVWSEASEPLELVREGSMTTIIWASCAAGLLLLLLLLLALAFVLHRKRKKGSSVNEINQPVSMSLEPNAEADPDGVSYAVLSHHSPTAKTAAKLDSIPESCVYATVAKNRTMED